MDIRIAHVPDAARTIEFLSKIRSEGLPTLLQHKGVPSEEEQKGFISKMNDSGGVMIVAEEKATIIGCLTAQTKAHLQMDHCCELGMGVLKSHRCLGIGTKLIGKLFDWADGRKLERIELSVFGNNQRAQRLYEKLGFVVEGQKKGAVKVNGEAIDLVEMVKRVDHKMR